MDFASDFTPLTVQAAREAISQSEKLILFVGGPFCFYCHRFVPKLEAVARVNQLDVAYLNVQQTKQLTEVNAFRQDYQISTIPGLLVAEKGQVRSVCDSSLSKEAILDFIG